jgi:hypothetical protein
MVCLINDHCVIGGTFEHFENPFLFQEIDGSNGQWDAVEGICPQFRGPTNLIELRIIHSFKPEAEALEHLGNPLVKQRARRGHQQNSVRHAPRNQLGEHKARLDGLSETNTIGEKQSNPTHTDGPKNRNELVGLKPQTPRLSSNQPVARQSLVQEKCLVVNYPVRLGRCPFRSKLRNDWLYSLEWV